MRLRRWVVLAVYVLAMGMVSTYAGAKPDHNRRDNISLSGDAVRALQVAWEAQSLLLQNDPDPDPKLNSLLLMANNYNFTLEDLGSEVRVIIRPNPTRLEIEGGGAKYLIRKRDFSVVAREMEK